MTRAAFAVAALLALALSAYVGIELWDTSVPDDLKLPDVPQSDFDAQTVRDAEAYERIARILSLASTVVMIAVLAVYARHGAKLVKESAAGPIGTGFLLGIVGWCLVWVCQLPFSLASFLWAQRYDLVEVSIFEWMLEQAFAPIGQALSVTLLLLVVMGFARWLRHAWWVPAAALGVAISLGLAFVSPFLLPTLERPPSEIRQDAQRLADETELDDIDVRIEEVREWTSAPNAYALGLGDSRKVVLWDTLTDDFPRDEVRVVLAHELGHHEHDHIWKMVLWSIVILVPTGIVVALVTWRRGGMGDPRSVPLALLVYVLLQLAFTPLNSQWSQRLESEADWTALNATKDPKAMEALFKGFTDEGMADPDPPGWWSDVFDSHPTGSDRVAMARAWKERNGR
jgi:STE24 endopeptidase